MSHSVICAIPLCAREVDNLDTIIMPAGRVCDTCYAWLAEIIEQAERQR